MNTRFSLLFAKVIAGPLLLLSVSVLLAETPPEQPTAPAQAIAAEGAQHDARAGKSPRQLPRLTPAPPYADRDRAAQQPSMQELGLKGPMDLAPLRARADARSRDARLHALVGQMEHLSGNRAAAEDRYQRAVDAAGKNADKLRHVLWSRGWARLYSGDNEGALLDWRDAAKLHGGKPEWYPNTLALAYWRAGQRDLGMRWFEASELAKDPQGREGLPHQGLPMIAQSLFGDMFYVRHLRSRPNTSRLPVGSSELVLPAYIASPAPKYPTTAAMSRRQGRTMTYACVDARGNVRNTQVATSSGHADLDRASAEAIAGWQFRPLICGGKTRDSWVAVPIEFVVSGTGGPFRNLRPRSPKPTDEPSNRKCESGVGLDPEGFTAVVSECYTHIACTADAVWKPDDCPDSANTAAAAP